MATVLLAHSYFMALDPKQHANYSAAPDGSCDATWLAGNRRTRVAVGAEHLLQRTSHRRWAAIVVPVPRWMWAKRFGAARPNLWGRIYRVETVAARETAGATAADDVGSGGTDCSVVADPSVVGATSVVGGASVVGDVSEVVGTEVAPDAPLAPTEVVGPAELVVRLLDGPADDPRSGA